MTVPIAVEMTLEELQRLFEVVEAREHRACVLLSRLVRQLEQIGGYTTHEQQQELRDARALLVECER